jgi:predicted DNA-binding protein
MASNRVTIRIGPALERQLRRRSALTGKDESTLIRAALKEYLSRTEDGVSAYDVARSEGLIGCCEGAPKDLSTDKKHLLGFGEDA